MLLVLVLVLVVVLLVRANRLLQPLVRVGVSIVDMCSGLHAVMGILAALHQRASTGLGQRVDTVHTDPCCSSSSTSLLFILV